MHERVRHAGGVGIFGRSSTTFDETSLSNDLEMKEFIVRERKCRCL